MNTGSILGRFGQQVQSTAEIMLTHNMVHFLGSDGHSLNRRRLNLVEGYEAARKIIGEEGAGRLVRENPEIVLKNEGFPIPEPRKYQKKKRFWFF